MANAGPSAANLTVADPLAAPFLNATWTCATTGSSVCPQASGSGALNETNVVVFPGADVTYVITAQVDPAARGTLTNTVITTQTETDPNPSDNRATDVDTLVPTADLTISKTNGQSSTTPGTTVEYIIEVFNQGPSSVTQAKVTDILPAGLANATWTCSATSAPTAGSCARPSGTGSPDLFVDLASGATATIVVRALVSADVVDNVVNTATVTVPIGVTDPDTTNNSATDEDSVKPVYDLAISKTDGSETATPGKELTYTIEVVNFGPSFARRVRVLDVLPETLTESTWTCSGRCVSVGGIGSVDALVDIPVGSRAIITITANVDPAAVGKLRNEATVQATGDGVDTNTGNNVAVDEDKLVPETEISITKTNGTDEVVAGEATEYIITVTNDGPSNGKAVTVTDVLPEGLKDANWTCEATEKSRCVTSVGTGSINAKVDLAVAGVATFKLRALVDPFATGSLTNVAKAAASTPDSDLDGSNNEATDLDKVLTKADLSVAKTHLGRVVAGDTVTYQIVVSNAGPSAVKGVSVADELPPSLTGAVWTCVAGTNSKCGSASGSSNLATTADVAPKSTVTYSLVATLDPSAPASVANTATVTGPASATDPNPANNTGTDTATPERIADIRVTKTDGHAYAVQGRENIYEIAIFNDGPSTAEGVSVSDRVPKAMSEVTWTCEASVGSSCSTASGSGDLIGQTVTVLPGGKVAFYVLGKVSKTALADMVNTATASAPANVTDPDLTNNSATDVDVMWKEWLANPPKAKRPQTAAAKSPPAAKKPKVQLSNPDEGTFKLVQARADEISPQLALTGSNADHLAMRALWILLAGLGLCLVALPRRRRFEPLCVTSDTLQCAFEPTKDPRTGQTI